MSKKGGRRFDQYINYRVGSMRMDSGVYLLSADRSALNLSGKIAQYERWIAGASAPSWAGRWQNVGDSDRVTVNMTLEDGTGSQFTMSLGAIRNSGGGDGLFKAIQRSAAGADIRRESDGKRVTIRDIKEAIGFRFRIQDRELYV